MSISTFEMFKIGIGPSSSHTVGPMRATYDFVKELAEQAKLAQVTTVIVELYGSLALTGIGHATDKAVLMGLEGEEPISVDPDSVETRVADITNNKKINLFHKHTINFNREQHLIFHYTENLPLHANGMRVTAYAEDGTIIKTEIYYSIGGGFIVTEASFSQPPALADLVPYPFDTAKQLLELCQANNLQIAELMFENEKTWRTEQEIQQGILHIAEVMEQCVMKGCEHTGILPGGLQVRRRAPELFKQLLKDGKPTPHHPKILNWLNVYAMAVNEENAAGGRVVTAPTNGAAGIIPAVLMYYKNFCEGANAEGVVKFLLTAAAIGILYKKGASISGAEMGCQGEVGVACSMAAGALAAAVGGTIEQIENAAEIGMEHNLGLTCDPVGGLVQIPCIERNAMGTVKAINAAELALAGDGKHAISLDRVIAVMRQTGKDMNVIYKETSLGGLAVNIVEC